MPTIPLELQEQVLGYLNGDLLSLTACTLVCKAWVPCIRHILYRTLHMNWDKRSRTLSLLQAFKHSREYVRNLTITRAGGLAPIELIRLLESLENLESLSIRTDHGPISTTSTSDNRSSVHAIMETISRVPDLDDRLLFAIADMPRLRHLAFGPEILLFATRSDVPCEARLSHALGLRELRSLCGDMFPIPRASRLWDAIAAKKAQQGAVPLLHFGATPGPGDSSLRPLARFLESIGEHLQSLWLDQRFIDMSAGTRFLDSGVSLKTCRSLRKLEFRLSRHGFTSCNALLCTVPHEAPLHKLAISISGLREGDFVNLPAPLSTPLTVLDTSIGNLVYLKRVEWRLVFVASGNAAPSIAGMKWHLPNLMTRPDVEVNWEAYCNNEVEGWGSYIDNSVRSMLDLCAIRREGWRVEVVPEDHHPPVRPERMSDLAIPLEVQERTLDFLLGGSQALRRVHASARRLEQPQAN